MRVYSNVPASGLTLWPYTNAGIASYTPRRGAASIVGLPHRRFRQKPPVPSNQS